MQYSAFTHGNAIAVEAPEVLAFYRHLGWGTQIIFKAPVPQDSPFGPVYNDVEPGSWFHLPLTSTLNTFGRHAPQLESATLLFQTENCRITNIHIYDGQNVIQQFNGLSLRGDYLGTRNAADINPNAEFPPSAELFPNTVVLQTPHKVFSAVGVSFLASSSFGDFRDANGFQFDPHFNGPFPPGVLTVAAVGAQYLVDESLLITNPVTATVQFVENLFGR